MSRTTNAVAVSTIGIDTGKNTLHLIGLGEVLGIVGDLKGIPGIISREIGDENKWLTRPLLLVVDGDAVGLDFRPAYYQK